MDFRFTPEQEAMRREFEEFFKEAVREAPPGWGAGMEQVYDTDAGFAFHRSMARKLGEKGWLSLPWPREYGGQAHSIIEQLIFNEVRAYYRAPGVDLFGVGMLAPTLLMWGSEEQKRHYLPQIARGEILWCQGWSEPNAGSDLAALTTRAVRDGDDYVINGQKIWTSGAHRADWCFMLLRTDVEQPRHRGLSFFLVDMKTPGITMRPLEDMARNHMFNEVFFDDVRVPAENMVGEENRGWYVTLMTMNFERSGVARIAETRHLLEELVEFCKETVRSGRPLSEDPFVRHRLAQLAIEIEVGRSMSYRVAWLQQKGEMPARQASAAKLYGTELMQRVAYTGYRTLGMYGQVKGSSRWAPLMGKFENECQTCMGHNIAAGSSEIQRNIIATRGLELPRA
ncbi:MAG: acyl-CoA dehydrogenase family protein [Chloroflexota bacterium]|nr:acyl-CoA dehydrogenase family protein [Chloroflexota bacterium]